MGREAYRSLYGDLTKLKDTSLLNLTGTGDDPELFQLLLANSGWTDSYANRHFYPRIQTLEFDGPGGARLLIPDLIAITSLKADENDDGAFEATWAATDYRLGPHNAEPTDHWAGPYTNITARTAGNKKSFLAGERNYEIVGRWGYLEYKEDSASNINDAGGISGTDLIVTVTSGADFAMGQTILVESEQMLVTNIAANNLTITRGLNGTTAAAHADALDVFILRWPPAVERATLINTARMWFRAPSFEPFYVGDVVDSDVRFLLEPYRRLPV
jgi:hypothetical protein